MYWTLELASKLEDAPWPASKDELIDYAIRSGAPMEVIENLQDIEDDEEIYSSSLESMIEENIKEDTVNNLDTENKEDDFLASIRNADFSEDEDNEIKTSITDSEDETDSILDAFKPDNFLSSVLRGL